MTYSLHDTTYAVLVRAYLDGSIRSRHSVRSGNRRNRSSALRWPPVHRRRGRQGGVVIWNFALLASLMIWKLEADRRALLARYRELRQQRSELRRILRQMPQGWEETE